MGLLVVTCIGGGCSSTSTGSGSPDPYDAVAYSPKRLKGDDESRKHFELFAHYFTRKHYGTALHALNELKRLRPADLTVDYHMGLVFANIGVPSVATSKLSYVLDRSPNVILKNRCSLALIMVSEGKKIDEDLIAQP